MSRYMRQVVTDAPLWRGVVRFWDGRTERYGPYPTRGGATQAINREIRRDNETKGAFYVKDPDAPAEQQWLTKRMENPLWKPAVFWHETATQWERAD